MKLLQCFILLLIVVALVTVFAKMRSQSGITIKNKSKISVSEDGVDAIRQLVQSMTKPLQCTRVHVMGEQSLQDLAVIRIPSHQGPSQYVVAHFPESRLGFVPLMMFQSKEQLIGYYRNRNQRIREIEKMVFIPSREKFEDKAREQTSWFSETKKSLLKLIGISEQTQPSESQIIIPPPLEEKKEPPKPEVKAEPSKKPVREMFQQLAMPF